MPATTREVVRHLYSEACHGAGAEVRNAARRLLTKLAKESDRTDTDLLAEHGLDLGAYFASRPISR
jgi:hypothetical protein